MRREQIGRHRRRRNLYHAAHEYIGIEGRALAFQIGLGLLHEIEHAKHFIQIRDHGDHHAHLAMGGGAQDRA